MPESIILLASRPTAYHVAAALEQHKAGLNILYASTAEQLADVAGSIDGATRLIGFCTDVVVPAEILGRLSGPAYNFHPGPPEYPGAFPISLALYDGATRFGTTLHEMAVQVDSGPIVGALAFDVPPEADLIWMKARAQKAAFRLLLHFSRPLATSDTALPPLAGAQWGARRASRRYVKSLTPIDPGLPPEEATRRRRAFADEPRLQD
ncbi:MAG: hypothetical protein KJ904_06365 [Alphaproteobacteria bacterium]|nr:hypothetical protein [Alphaproteobacteria bacterium]MBU0796419.1 hypothetical protein [Alphaproteobacteria bacterium]MBU0886770.1 hypothetical protein [Alphaproteobacteria bacterium]MBU1812617.1 hypothetical protein [Alphaproteobacteria bacterium]MBU2091934.1 hypothetical protein [Alphaproteobacteria bacterium]